MINAVLCNAQVERVFRKRFVQSFRVCIDRTNRRLNIVFLKQCVIFACKRISRNDSDLLRRMLLAKRGKRPGTDIQDGYFFAWKMRQQGTKLLGKLRV